MAEGKTDQTDKLEQTEKLEQTTQAEEYVTIELFKGGKEFQDDLICSINGKVFQIQRGKQVRVPRYVADFIETARQQDNYANSLIESELKRFDQKADRL